MSTLGAGPLVSLSLHHCLPPPGPGVPSLEDMALLLVLVSPGDMFCTGIGPLGYLNLLLLLLVLELLLLELLLLLTPSAAGDIG